MAETNDDRAVMVRDWYHVPAIPSETLRLVFGNRELKRNVELAALVVEYWVNTQTAQWLIRAEILKILKIHIDNAFEMRDLIALLALRGYADEFFDLTRTTVDKDGAFRAFLLSREVSVDTIRHYASWNGISPKLFIDGFLFGLLESAATVVTDLPQLVKLLVRLNQTQLNSLLLLIADPQAGVQNLYEQAATVGQLFNALIAQLDPTRLPAKIVKQWKEWNEEFERHLENLDPFAAGHLLGRIAGDLWQLLTGLVALVKLLRIAARLALRYAPLLIGAVRSAAAEARMMIDNLAALLAAIGRTVIDGLPTVGLGLLRTLFPPELLRELWKKGRAFLMHHEFTLFPVFEEAYALAYGSQMSTRFGVVICEEGQPILMAAMSDRLPAAGRGATRAQAMAAIDEILDQLDDLFREPGRRPVQMPPNRAAVKAAAVAMLKQRLDTRLRNMLQKTAYEAFADLRRRKRKFYPNDLGRLIHTRMAARTGAEIAQATPDAWFRTEKTLRTIMNELLAADTSTSSAALQRAKKVLDQTVAEMLTRRPDVLDILGMERTTAARSEKSIAKLLRERYGWKSKTTVGDLQSDLTIADIEAKRVINVDWTSSTYSDRFEKVWGKVVDDLGSKFNGDWDALADAYQRAGKGKVPDEVKAGLDELTWHAVRETVVRKAALEEILGPLWNITSHEMTYDGLRKLFAME